jgi:hypothetical protein
VIGISEKDIAQNDGEANDGDLNDGSLNDKAINEVLPPKKKSKLREEVESMLAEKGITLEERIAVMSMDSGQSYYFDDYPQALQFLKGKKGRWYLTTPGIKRAFKPGTEGRT